MPQIRINGTMKDVITSRIYLPTYLDSPTNYFYNKKENPEAKAPESAIPFYKSMGIGIEEEHPGDYMSICILPNGWGYVTDPGGYWTTIIDDKQRKRFTYFEKMCFWDRDAFTRKYRRYNYTWDYDVYHKEPGQLTIRYIVTDGDGTELFDAGTVVIKDESDNEDRDTRLAFYDKRDSIEKDLISKCEEYLDTNFPDWKNYDAYWD